MVSSPLERGITAALEGAGNRMWGFRPHLMAPAVRQLGPLRAVRWFGWNMPRYLRTLKVLGGLRTHLIGAVISLINGCPYGTKGEVYAFQLIHVRERGVVFPLDEEAVAQLCGQPPAMIRHALVDALQRAGLYAEVPVLDRAIALTVGEDRRPTDRDDIRIAHLVRMLSVLNSVGINNGVRMSSNEALDAVNKDRPLKQLYAGLRDATSTV